MARVPAFQAGTTSGNCPQDKHFGQSSADPQQYPQQCAAETGVSDPDLQRVIEAWADLPEAVKAGIVATVKAVRQGGGR